MSLGAEFHGWGTTIGEEVEHIADIRKMLQCVNLGATAIGTTVTAAPGYPALATKHLSDITGIKFSLAEDLIEATSDTGDYVLLSGVIKHTAVKLTKICNDLRMLASGPRCGLNEINLPQMQPGSSIMPGKVNPVIPEVVNQTSFLVIGLDVTVTLAASAGQLQLNVMEPVITFALFASIATMERAVTSLGEESLLKLAQRFHVALEPEDQPEMESRRIDVVRRLAEVHMVIGIEVLILAFFVS